MLFFFFILISLFGLVIGSFFNVIIDRIYRDEQFIKGHSYCEKCKHELSTKDLIPIISYISLRGKCRYCNERIPFFLNITEIVSASVLTISLYWFFEKSNFNIILQYPLPYLLNLQQIIFLLGLILFVSFLLLIFLMDLKYQVIPDVFLYGLLIIYIAGYLFYKLLGFGFAGYSTMLFEPIIMHLLAGFAMFIFFAALHYGFKGKAMGEGDIYLSSILGLYLGLPATIIMWFAAFLTGALIGSLLMIFKSKTMKSKIAFGPFLIIGYVIAQVWGLTLWEFYISLF